MEVRRSELVTIADTQVPAAVTEDGKVYFPPRHICESLGITWQGQHVKIMADPVLASCVTEIVMQVSGQGRTADHHLKSEETPKGWFIEGPCHVLRDIDDLRSKIGEQAKSWFLPSNYQTATGFMLIIMGYTGTKAVATRPPPPHARRRGHMRKHAAPSCWSSKLTGRSFYRLTCGNAITAFLWLR